MLQYMDTDYASQKTIPEALHLLYIGYVLSCLPFMSEDHMTIHEQLKLIKNLKLPPDFIINIQVYPLFKNNLVIDSNNFLDKLTL